MSCGLERANRGVCFRYLICIKAWLRHCWLFFKQARKAASHSEAKSVQIIQQINMIGLIYLVMPPVIISFFYKMYRPIP